MNPTEYQAWLQLAFTPHIGAESFAALLQVYGTASEALNAPAQAIAQLGRHGKQAAAQWHQTDNARRAVEHALQWSEQEDCHLLLSCDDHFPSRLSEGMTAPPVLFARGNIHLLHRTSIGIVGSRHASPQALRIAQEFAQALSEQDITIISGMATGIDTAAHIGALKGKGSTISVWGTGIDRIYPASNQQLARNLAEQGIIISEFPLGTRPLAGNFPRRNRIIAAQSTGILVVEAAVESGSLITARQAVDMGREVMAIPGSIDNPHSRGCHKLIKEGAKLVDCLDDILHELHNIATDTYPQNIPKKSQKKQIETTYSSPSTPSLLSTLSTKLSTAQTAAQNHYLQAARSLNEEPELLRQMGYDPIHPDILAERLNQSTAEIYAQLTELELEGTVIACSGGRFQRIQ